MVDEDGRERMVGAQSHSQNLNHGRDVAFLFFLIKGLLWLLVPAAAWAVACFRSG